MHSKFSVQRGCVLSMAEGHLEILTVMQRRFPKASVKIKRDQCYTSEKLIERKMPQSATDKGCGKCQLIWDGKYKGTECWLGFGPVLGWDVLAAQWNEERAGGGAPPKMS